MGGDDLSLTIDPTPANSEWEMDTSSPLPAAVTTLESDAEMLPAEAEAVTTPAPALVEAAVTVAPPLAPPPAAKTEAAASPIAAGLANVRLPLPFCSGPSTGSQAATVPESAPEAAAAAPPPTPPAAATKEVTTTFIAAGLANVRLPLPSHCGQNGTGAAAFATEAATAPSPPSPAPVVIAVGDEVVCTFGRGVVRDIREDGIHVVRASAWLLANEVAPTFYLQRSALQKALPKLPFDMTPTEKLERGALLKGRGAAAYAAGEMAEANGLYCQALAVLRTNGEDMSNKERARLLDLMVPCQNNVAMIQYKLKNFKDAILAASNAVSLCEALQSNSTGHVMRELRLRGVSDIRVLQWKSKALFLAGRAHVGREEFAEAVQKLEAAVTAAASHPSLARELPTMKDMLSRAAAHLRAREAKERRMWKGAFEKNSAVAKEKEAAAAAEPAAATNGAAKTNGAAATNGAMNGRAAAAGVVGNGKPAVALPAGLANGFGPFRVLGPLKAMPPANGGAAADSGDDKAAESKHSKRILTYAAIGGVALAAAAAVAVWARSSRR
ncbi:unnamed protein product [Phaeothamnion confervicola]